VEAEYIAGPVERFGRRFKIEYLGMVSIYAIIGLFVFRGLSSWLNIFFGALGAQFFFLGLKKKTRDHLSGSLVMLAACWVASPAVVNLEWAVPFLLFGCCVCAMEGYVELHPAQIFALPLLFFIWGWFGFGWVPALLFAAVYLSDKREHKPGLHRKLMWVLAGAAAAPWVGFLVSHGGRLGELPARVPLSRGHLLGLALFAVPVLVCVVVYWRRALLPHRINVLLFALLAPWDVRLALMFAMIGAVLLTATVFRFSIDSDRLRPFFKHAEWHYFWYAFAFVIWVIIDY
jgi:hypothetical protein